METTRRRRGFPPDEELTAFQLFLRKCTIAYLDNIFFYAFGSLLTPIHYSCSMLYIRSRVVTDCSTLRNTIEIAISFFFFINVYGNFVMNFITDTSVKNRVSNHKKLTCSSERSQDAEVLRFCNKCKVYQPEGSWHCKRCDICVVERDYHCFVFGQCVARYTKRFYITGLTYAFVGMIYHTYYAFQYPCTDDFEGKLSTPVIKMILKMVYIPYFLEFFKTFGCFEKIFILITNFTIFVVVSYLLGFNVKNIIRGVYPWQRMEAKKKNLTIIEKGFWSRPIKQEMEEIFGVRWYWAILWPFVSSPLPEPKEHGI